MYVCMYPLGNEAASFTMMQGILTDIEKLMTH